MISLTKVISTLQNGFRAVKVLRFGVNDVQEIKQSSPFGIDSNPIKDMVAVYANTSAKGESVVIGYINKNQIAESGETRLFSTDAGGSVQFYVHLKNDGTAEIGGDADNLVRYTPLDFALGQQCTDITTELNKISVLLSSIGLIYTVVPIQIDITDSKIEEIKTL